MFSPNMRDELQAVEQADLVIEAIPEQLELKHKLFRTIDDAAPKHTIFASNTSSLSIGLFPCGLALTLFRGHCLLHQALGQVWRLAFFQSGSGDGLSLYKKRGFFEIIRNCSKLFERTKRAKSRSKQ